MDSYVVQLIKHKVPNLEDFEDFNAIVNKVLDGDHESMINILTLSQYYLEINAHVDGICEYVNHLSNDIHLTYESGIPTKDMYHAVVANQFICHRIVHKDTTALTTDDCIIIGCCSKWFTNLTKLSELTQQLWKMVEVLQNLFNTLSRNIGVQLPSIHIAAFYRCEYALDLIDTHSPISSIVEDFIFPYYINMRLSFRPFISDTFSCQLTKTLLNDDTEILGTSLNMMLDLIESKDNPLSHRIMDDIDIDMLRLLLVGIYLEINTNFYKNQHTSIVKRGVISNIPTMIVSDDNIRYLVVKSIVNEGVDTVSLFKGVSRDTSTAEESLDIRENSYRRL